MSKPEQIWALSSPENNGLVPPMDHDADFGAFLAYPSEESAKDGARNQAQWFDGVEPTPIRLA